MKPVYVFGSKTKPTCELNTTDSFVTNAVNLCLMLKDDFDVTLVGLPGSGKGRPGNPDEGDLPAAAQAGLGVKVMTWDQALPELRAEPDTAIVCVTGPDHLADALQLPQTICEPTRGYDRPVFTRHIAFPSWAWLHYHVGRHGAPDGWQDWRMIPHTIVPERFIYREKKQDFVLFLGRLTHGKGLHIAIEACRLALGNAGQRSVTTGRNVRTEAACENGLVGPPGRAGGAFADTPTARSVPANLCGLADLRLVVAGTHHGPESDELLDLGRQALGSAFEYVGFADYWKRRELLADAKALMYPTPALEPFGYTVLEANVSGTPALVSNWGAFTETVQNGVNGFRCRDAAGLAAALGELDRLTHAACRSSAVSRFGLTTCGTAMCRLLLSRGGAT